ncbi:serine protease [Allomyces javanicus]|nr:serine protease [Allomyces javanicus]
MLARLLHATLLAAALLAVTSEASPMRHGAIDMAPLMSSTTADAIPDQYLVVLKDELSADHVAEHHNWLATTMAFQAANADGVMANHIKHVYNVPNGVRGYAGRFSADVLDAIRTSPHVAYVEQDQVMRTLGVQNDAPWGLSRISHRNKPDTAHYAEYPFAENAGEGVTVYVVDTGINYNHVDFEGRASWGITIPRRASDRDGNGHGTHCAGTIAGKRFGVAKKAKVVAVKVLGDNGSGSTSDVIKGIEWVVEQHQERRKKDKHAKSVANSSLGGGKSRVMDSTVNAAVEAGVHFAVAAGNDATNACNSSPAAAEKAITVGATSQNDAMAYFSNYGKCVDVFAPGHNILSTWTGSNTATNTISGTSMAAPHVAGLAAYVLSQHPTKDFTGEELKEYIVKTATKGKITGLPKPKEGGGRPKQPTLPWPFPFPNPGGDGGDAGESPNVLIYTGKVRKNKKGRKIAGVEVEIEEVAEGVKDITLTQEGARRMLADLEDRAEEGLWAWLQNLVL